MPIAMIVSRFHVMSMVPKPGCGLESECGTVKFFCVITCAFGAPPYFEPWIHPCSNTMNYASCGLVHQSFTSSCTSPTLPSSLHQSSKKNPQLFISAFHFSFSFRSAFQLSFSSFSTYPSQVPVPYSLQSD